MEWLDVQKNKFTRKSQFGSLGFMCVSSFYVIEEGNENNMPKSNEESGTNKQYSMITIWVIIIAIDL